MAENQELQQKLDLLRQINAIKIQLNQSPIDAGLADALDLDTLKEQLVDVKEQLSSIEGSFTNLYEKLRQITLETRSQAQNATTARTALSRTERLTEQLKNHEQGITVLSSEKLHKLKEQLELNKENRSELVKQILQQDASARQAVKQAQDARLQGVSEQDITDFLISQLTLSQDLTLAQKSLLLLEYDRQKIAGKLLTFNDQIERSLNKQIGKQAVLRQIGTATVAAINKLTGMLGIPLNTLSTAGSAAVKSFEDAKKHSKGLSAALTAGAGAFLLGVVTSISLVTRLFESYFKVNEAAVNLTRELGYHTDLTDALNDNVGTSVQYFETVLELTRALNRDANTIFSKDQIAGLVEMKNMLGISSDQSNNMATSMLLSGQSAQDVHKQTIQAYKAMVLNTREGVSLGQAQKGVLEASIATKASLGGSVVELTKAQFQAQRLGLELKNIEQIQRSLLDFESSIAAELEAELLTGRSMNLERARMYAMTNDYAKLSEEIVQNTGDIYEYQRLGYIGQEAYAKSLGVSRDELAKMMLLRGQNLKMSSKELENALGITEESQKIMADQDRVGKSLDKLTQSLAPLLEQVIVPAAEALAYVLNIGSGFIGKMTIGLLAMYIPMKSLVTTAAAFQTIMRAEAFSGMVNAFQKVWTFTKGIVTFQKLANIQSAIGAALESRRVAIQAAGAAIARGGLMASIGSAIASAWASAMSLGPIAGPIAAVGLSALVGAAVGKYLLADDMVSTPGYGDRVLTGPEGSIALNNNDTVVAGTDLFKSKSTGAQYNQGQGMVIAPLVDEVRMLRQEMKRILTRIANKDSNLYMDGNKVGSSLVLSTNKLS